TRAGHTVKERISIEGVEGESDLLYDMTYQTVLNNLKSSNHQLHHSEELPGLYYFHSSSNKEWDETPFEFDEAVLKLFPDLPEHPATRYNGKLEEYRLPTAPKPPAKPAKQPQNKRSEKKRPPAKKDERQPDSRLTPEITLTALGTGDFPRPPTSRRDIFDYYD